MNEDKPYKRLLDSITNGFKKVLDSNILGLYVHGSIAFGCFMPDKSDLDFIALVRQPLHCSEKHHLLECILKEMPHAPAKGIEMSVVLAKYAKEFLYPTPYELHFSLEWLNLAVEHPDTLCTDGEKVDYDLAAHFKVITERGLVWYGDAIDKVFSEVPWNVYLDSIERDKPKTLIF
ncbi:MAG: hypothetical protein VB108_05560 [Anaerolineaceae bacterium]|nr:hypothetical protein [Anaerolineaceae bacterium]